MSAALGGLGVASGALAARMTALQPLRVPLSAGFLGVAFYMAYRRRSGSRRQRVLLWVTAPVTVVLWILPHLVK